MRKGGAIKYKKNALYDDPCDNAKLCVSKLKKIDSIINNILTDKNFIPSYQSFIFSLCYDIRDNYMILIDIEGEPRSIKLLEVIDLSFSHL